MSYRSGLEQAATTAASSVPKTGYVAMTLIGLFCLTLGLVLVLNVRGVSRKGEDLHRRVLGPLSFSRFMPNRWLAIVGWVFLPLGLVMTLIGVVHLLT